MQAPHPLTEIPSVSQREDQSESHPSLSARAASIVARVARLIGSNLTPHQIQSNLFGILKEELCIDRMVLVELGPGERERVSIYPPPSAPNPELVERYAAKARELQGDHERSVYIPLATTPAPSPGIAQVRDDAAPSAIAAPLVSQGSFDGILIVESHSPDRQLTDEDGQLLADAALLIALHIKRERALEEARRRMDQMAAFSAVSSTVNEWVDVEQLARRFLSVFLNSTGTTYGLFYLLEGEEQLRLIAQFGLPAELYESFRIGHVSLHPDLERVLGQGQLVTSDVQSAGISETARELALMIPVTSVAMLPLRVKGRGIGIVTLGRSHGEIDIADREFVQGLADQAAQAVENARLIAESQRRFEEQSALRELAQRFLSAVSPEEVIERTLESLTSLLHGDYYEILLPDNDGAFVLVNGRGWRRGIVGRTRVVSDPHFHAGYVLRAQSPVIVENFATETRFQPSDYLVRHQAISGVCAPMLAETRVIGLLGVYSRSQRQFMEEQSHFLYLVATQTAMALEKARHFQEAQRRLGELILLNDVIVAANSEVSLDRVLETVTGEIGSLLQSEDVQVYFATEDEDSAELRAALPSASGEAAAGWARVLATWVVRNKQPLLVQDVARDLRFEGVMRARTALGVPMMIGERVIGVIAVAHPEPNAFDTNDLRLLITLAGQIGAAIERARLLDETAKRLAEISAMFVFSNELRTPTTEPRLLQLVLQNAVSMLQAVGGSLQLLVPNGEYLKVAAVENMKHLGALHPRERGGLSWEAFQTGESIAIEDVATDPRMNLPNVFQGMHGGIVTPLSTPSGALGTLFVGFAERGKPGQDKVRLATTIGNLAAQALQRLRLNEQTVEQAASLARALSELEASYQATLLALSATLDARDRETEGHSQRVTKLALAIGRKLALTPKELTNLERGALLHDVGKIGISDNILLKAGSLTPEERELMHRHPEMGYEMLKGVPFLQEALPVVLHHQEMYDGTGYPHGLSGEQIPLGARIFAVADSYDAMTSTRPYRAAMRHEDALQEILRCRGTQFDPRVVEAFLSLFDEPGELDSIINL